MHFPWLPCVLAPDSRCYSWHWPFWWAWCSPCGLARQDEFDPGTALSVCLRRPTPPGGVITSPHRGGAVRLCRFHLLGIVGPARPIWEYAVPELSSHAARFPHKPVSTTPGPPVTSSTTATWMAGGLRAPARSGEDLVGPRPWDRRNTTREREPGFYGRVRKRKQAEIAAHGGTRIQVTGPILL